MRARHLPLPSPENTRQRLADLLDSTPDTEWNEEADAIDHDQPSDRADRAGARSASVPWRRETVLVVCAIVLIGIVISGLVALRSSPLELTGVTATPVAASVMPGGQPSPGADASVPEASPPASEPLASTSASRPAVAAHVIGEVERPGLITLPEGARVDDAITAAGGLTSEADPGDLNLAQPLRDGQQIVVGSAAKPGGEVRGPDQATAASAVSGSAGATINLNTASSAELEELPGVGPATAQKIISWREQNGGFATVEQLMDVPGIGPKTFAEIAPRASV